MKLLNIDLRSNVLCYTERSSWKKQKLPSRWETLKHGSLRPCLPQGTPADVLYKGTITRLITEDSASRIERERDEVLSKGHVVYEGISGHILTYDRKCSLD